MPLVSPLSPSDRFDAVRAALVDLDAAQLAAAAGALTLLPSNGHRPWRLGTLATLAAERPGGGAAVSASRLRAIVNVGDLASIAAQQDDPFDDVLAEELVFHGGSYLVGPGLAENSVCVLRLVMRGLLQVEVFPATLRAELSRLCSAALRLSDLILRVGGLVRNQDPVIGHAREMEVPSQARLRALMSLCTFEDRDLYEIGVEPAVLQPLVLAAGARHFEESQILGGFADQWPLVRFGDKLVLARPFDLLVALRHHMLLRAVNVAGEDLVACVFAKAVQSDVLASLQRMGVGAQVTKARTAEQPWIEVEAQLDNGLLLVSMIVPDSMRGLTSDPYGTFDTAHLPAAVRARLEARAAGYAGQVLGLLVFQPAGRGVFMGLNEPEAANLILEQITGADLGIFAFLSKVSPWPCGNLL